MPDSRALLQKRVPSGDSDSDSEEPVRLQLHVTALRDERVARQFCVTAEAETTVAELGARVVPTRPWKRKKSRKSMDGLSSALSDSRCVSEPLGFQIMQQGNHCHFNGVECILRPLCIYIRAILADSCWFLDSLHAGVTSGAPE